MDLSKWTIFSLQDERFLASLRTVCVFGNGDQALVITKDDQVYAFGTNEKGCLGLGDTVNTLKPKKVKELCGMSVRGIAYGSSPHVLVHTAAGKVYSWGNNSYYQLGLMMQPIPVYTPSLVSTNLIDKVVVQVACGANHSMVLTADGAVYAWGQFDCNVTTSNQSSPMKVAYIDRLKVVSIGCGQSFSMAVLETGEVYGWGYNSKGELGFENNQNLGGYRANQGCSYPSQMVALKGIVITQIVCGFNHTLALSNKGVMYAWGSNSFGQLGTGSMTIQGTPQRITKDIGQVIEIASSHNISAAKTQASKVYMWGMCRGQSLLSPTETPFQSIHDVFACFASPAVTFKPIIFDADSAAFVRRPCTTGIMDCLKIAFNDSATADLKFLVEDKIIHVHKAVLQIRCEHFRSMFQKDHEGAKKKVVEIDDFSYVVYHAFLQYLYTDNVNLGPNDAIGLLELANSYCEQHLKCQCEQIIMGGVSVDNAATLYKVAIRYLAKELEEFCFRFMVNNLTSVAQSPTFASLDELTYKNLIQKAALLGAFKEVKI